ncbi:sugar-binding transcriptional regulator [Actinacidiphila bryophytorum]|uniref:Sugar-binding transcriptional regulator n=2 Tax=Actinacidiphila bryophytorum TaxID=1436133 RepID=A0A9W4ECR9_9ACTN|nr:sugar-binding transcriptional regulator [Actinacidiphila bryophytorum]MBM9438384.1 sugar-binding transcriptional regulator [Actinacidiphila bryophytorum]MBN6543489.1 sugar-binding transcriptional regulator [Actinacidiphila bryophytorum]CAG7614291.1 Sugar-binding transcriptional regulator [Actinacidiphila bryophytorum]
MSHVGHDQVDKLRLIVRVARMYHERGLRQNQIAQQLNLSQAGVSRLLRAAGDLGIVRTVVVSPGGIHSELEDEVAARYHLADAVVTDSDDLLDHPKIMMRALGSAAASYLETAFRAGDRIGVSTWSETLLAAVDAMPPLKQPVGGRIVQLMGGIGDPQGQVQATRLTARLADLVGATPLFVRSPGLVGSAEARVSLLSDPFIREVSHSWQQLTAVLVGIGSVEPSPLLQLSGNAVPEEELIRLRSLGAVGDICQRFFDASGAHLDAGLGERTIGVSPDQLRSVPRRIAVAGGARKYAAVRAAVRGRWITTLITDLHTARRLVDEP